MQLKLLILLAILGHLGTTTVTVAAASNHRFTDYSDPSQRNARVAQAPRQDQAADRDPAAWIRSGSAQDFAAPNARRRSSLLPGFPTMGSGASDPFSAWNQYMVDVLRSMIPGGGGASWFGDDSDEPASSAEDKPSVMRLPPGVYARETESERLFFMDLPGFHRSEVAVEVVAGHLLSVKAERKCDPTDAYCTSRAIKHTLELDPDTIDTRKISVNLDAGQLRVHLPKRSATRFAIPVIDSLFGLNQPGSGDKAGDKVKIKNVNNDIGTGAREGAIYWPERETQTGGGSGIVDTVKEWYEQAKESAGSVVESAESVALRAKNAALGTATGATREGEHAAQDAAEYARRAVHHTTDTLQDTADHARANVQQAGSQAQEQARDAGRRASNLAQGARDAVYGKVQDARDTAYGTAQDAAEALYGAYGSAAEGLDQAAQAATDARTRAGQAAADTAARARDAARGTARQAYDAAAAGVHGAQGAARQAEATAVGAAGKVAQVARDAAQGVQAKAGEAVDVAKGTAESLKQAVERNVVEPVESAAEAAKNRAGQVVDATQQTAGQVVDATKHKAAEAVDATKQKAGSWFGLFQDVSAGAKEAAKEGSEGVKEGWEKGQHESRMKRQAGQ